MQSVEFIDRQLSTGKTPDLPLLLKKDREMPDGVNMSILRYQADTSVRSRDAGLLVYRYMGASDKEEHKYLELRFCLLGNKYCPENCKNCPVNHQIETMDCFSFRFQPSFLRKIMGDEVNISSTREKVLAFQYTKSFSRKLEVGSQKRNVLNALLQRQYPTALDNIFFQAKVNELLLYSMETLEEQITELPACPFLFEAEMLNRIYDARDILLANLGTPLTIKELSRKVAINECYLKKGFKEIFGVTIFDFCQQKRMEHARNLLYNKGLKVSEVAELLGYSSISHFSTAFKKFTGLKPCELLLHTR